MTTENRQALTDDFQANIRLIKFIFGHYRRDAARSSGLREQIESDGLIFYDC